MIMKIIEKEAVDAIEALQTCAKMVALELDSESDNLDEVQKNALNTILNSISTQIEAINSNIVFPLPPGNPTITDSQKIELLAGASTTFKRVQSLFTAQF